MNNNLDTEIIYNTLGDIHDKPWVGYDVQTKESVKENSDTIITELDGSFLGHYTISEELGGGRLDYDLSDYLEKLPHGIFDKKVTGIGATTIEIKSNRNSILVMPTKALAYGKAMKHNDSLYIGSAIGDLNTTTEDDIISYVNNIPKDKYKKMLVVADSLGKLINVLIYLNIDVYNDYFLMVDEIDCLQDDGNYRPALENIIDYYFKFNVKKRCLVSATIRNLSNPRFKKECKFDISKAFKQKRNINLFLTDNINKLTSLEILKHPREKILVAYNSITEILNIISLLDEPLQKECAILCSEASQKEVGTYYLTLNDDYTLPNRIVFMTCTYFTGIDIYDNYHLITVSNTRKSYQILSPDRMTQIYGRCRIKNGILSDTIIYNLNQYLFKGGIKNYQNTQLKKAEAICELINAANSISQNDSDLEKLFDIVKLAIKEKSVEIVYGESPVDLVRTNIEGRVVPAYFNIDYLTEKKDLLSGIYHYEDYLPNFFKRNQNLLDFKKIYLAPDKEQRKIEEYNSEKRKKIIDEEIKLAIDKIKELDYRGSLNSLSINKLIRVNKKYSKSFYSYFNKLYHFINTEQLCDYLWEIREKNIKAYKSLNNSIMYWALDDKHPFKVAIRQGFIVGEKYSSLEIHETIQPIIKVHFHKTIEQVSSVTLFNTFYLTERPKYEYKIIKEYSKDFEEHKAKISAHENNLRKYFTL